MNAGNASLLQGMHDGLEIAGHYLAAGRLTPEDAGYFKQWRRESLATEVMIHAVNGALPAALAAAARGVAREPLTAVTLARLGTLAVYRRLRTWNRIRQAHHEA
jgi:hypothetical protein